MACTVVVGRLAIHASLRLAQRRFTTGADDRGFTPKGNEMTNTQRKFGWLRAGLAGGALAVAAVGGVLAQAQPGGHGKAGMHGSHGMGGMDMGMGAGMGAGMGMGGSPERAAKMMDHMLDGLNATEAQRAQIKQIAAGLATDMKPQHEAGRVLRDKATALMTAPNVDANAAEQLRQQMLAQHDQMSRRMMTAMLDVSRVLTPEQRAQMAERMKQRESAMNDRRQRMERGQPKS